MPTVLEKAVLLDETGQEIVSKLDDIKDAIGTSGEFIPLMIKVTTPPTKTSYIEGETLDLTGMVVNLVASNGVQIDVTSACTCYPADGSVVTSSTTSISISFYYAQDDYTFTTSQALSIAQIDTISVYNAPTKTHYRAGESLDLTGIIVKALYDNGSSIDVTSDCVFNPSNGATLTSNDNVVSISYTTDGNTYTTSQGIRVDYLFDLEVTTPPTKTSYGTGETLDLSGIVVTATYTDNTTENVASSCTYVPANGTTLSTDNTSISISYTEAGITKTTDQEITVSSPIYGVEWDGTSSPILTRTDDAVGFADPVPYYAGMTDTPSSPFDNIMPWAGMVRVTDTDAGELVAIPKFYYKLTQPSDSDALKIQISNSPVEGFSVSPTHMDRGDGVGERDVVYVGRYHCASTYKSTSGVNPKRRVSKADARTSIHNLGTDIWQYDFATLFSIWLLYVVEFAHFDSQRKIGGGSGNNGDIVSMGYTDSMPYHTGTTQSSHSAIGIGTQYRYIEGLWDNGLDILDGSYLTSNDLYLILNPNDFSDSANGIRVGNFPASGVPTSVNVINITGLFPVILPNSAISSSDYSTYLCDMWANNTSTVIKWLSAGGYYGDPSNSTYKQGLLYIETTQMDVIPSMGSAGCRLIKLPNAS